MSNQGSSMASACPRVVSLPAAPRQRRLPRTLVCDNKSRMHLFWTNARRRRGRRDQGPGSCWRSWKGHL
ncbi:hypothetical protein IG631_00100 [Alternaria alternata]|nr:hypothetical protein IG631_00100 [Alternaria alternata]